MNQGVTYYPTIPMAFEGRWDGSRHVFKSSQPYQENNIGDQGLGSRFYGLGTWWKFVALYAGMPYLIGRLAGDTDTTPGTTLQKTRFFLAQEQLDLGELFGNYAAHTLTWDWPHLGHVNYEKEQQPFKGIANWCTTNSGNDCTIDSLKIQVSLGADGTNGEWRHGPPDRNPGGFAYSTVRISNAPAESIYEFGLDFDVPSTLYSTEAFYINMAQHCRDDPRLFSNRIVVVDRGSEGAKVRANRPRYYKVPGRYFDKFYVQVPKGRDSNIYLLAVPTPPFEFEDVHPINPPPPFLHPANPPPTLMLESMGSQQPVGPEPPPPSLSWCLLYTTLVAFLCLTS